MSLEFLGGEGNSAGAALGGIQNKTRIEQNKEGKGEGGGIKIKAEIPPKKSAFWEIRESLAPSVGAGNYRAPGRPSAAAPFPFFPLFRGNFGISASPPARRSRFYSWF